MAFDKYEYYLKSVQSASMDAELLLSWYAKFSTNPKDEYLTFGEDFCGTWRLCHEFVKLNNTFKGVAVDLDAEPLDYGYRNNNCTDDEQNRISTFQKNVMDSELLKPTGKVDILDAQNFSYWVFKTEEELRLYFQQVRSRLKNNGVFVIDLFGGEQTVEPNVEKTKHKGFNYEWELVDCNPINNNIEYQINFNIKSEAKKRKGVFTYSWRQWTIPELLRILKEAGFNSSHVLEEDSNDIWSLTNKVEHVQYVCYIVSSES